MCNIPVNITLDSLVDRYMLASDDSEITSLSFEKKLGRAKEDFACILEKKITPHPILVNRENKIVLRQFNMWDLLFFEN